MLGLSDGALSGDRWLLQLEQMQLLDMAHSWSAGTTQGYQSKIRKVARFELSHPGLDILKPSRIESPPAGTDIPTMWVELDESVHVLKAKGRFEERTVVYGTVRQIRSAVSQYQTWDIMVSSGRNSYFLERRHVEGTCRATDSAAYALYDQGLAVRIGSNPKPCTPLLGRNVIWLDRWMDKRYREAPTWTERRNWAMAGTANALMWLGWLRGGGEAFARRWQDLSFIKHRAGPSYDQQKKHPPPLKEKREMEVHRGYLREKKVKRERREMPRPKRRLSGSGGSSPGGIGGKGAGTGPVHGLGPTPNHKGHPKGAPPRTTLWD